MSAARKALRLAIEEHEDMLADVAYNAARDMLIAIGFESVAGRVDVEAAAWLAERLARGFTTAVEIAIEEDMDAASATGVHSRPTPQQG